MSSSSSPNKWSKLAKKRPNTNCSDNFKPWKMPEELKKQVMAKDEEIVNHNSEICQLRKHTDEMEMQLGKNGKKIKDLKRDIKIAEQWIKEAEGNVKWGEDSLLYEVKEKKRKEAWINQEKNKFPLDYPVADD